MEEPPGPPVSHNASGSVPDAVEAVDWEALLKYQKKRCLGPTSSQPVNCSTVVLQRVAFWRLMRSEWRGET